MYATVRYLDDSPCRSAISSKWDSPGSSSSRGRVCRMACNRANESQHCPRKRCVASNSSPVASGCCSSRRTCTQHPWYTRVRTTRCSERYAWRLRVCEHSKRSQHDADSPFARAMRSRDGPLEKYYSDVKSEVSQTEAVTYRTDIFVRENPAREKSRCSFFGKQEEASKK